MEITDVRELESGDWELDYSATKEEITKLANLGVRFALTCAALGMSTEEAFKVLQKGLPDV